MNDLFEQLDVRCGCRKCLQDNEVGRKIGDFFVPAEMSMMILCAKCGNKKCPHANDHRNECTNSNLRGQPGSAYP